LEVWLVVAPGWVSALDALMESFSTSADTGFLLGVEGRAV